MNKYLVIFDLETSGKDPKIDHIIQFAGVKVNTETQEIVDSRNYYIQPDGPYVMSIPALAKHKIHPDFLKDKPLFADVAQDIYDFILGCDLCGYNLINFDCKFLKEKFLVVGLYWDYSSIDIYDVFLEEQRRNGLNLGKVYARYNNGKTMEENGLSAHDALSDIYATLDIFKKQQQVEKYGPENIISECGMLKFMPFYNHDSIECFTYGKWKEVSIPYVVKNDKNYIDWILRNPDIDKKTKETCKKYL